MQLNPEYGYHNPIDQEYNPASIRSEISYMERNIKEIENYIEALKAKLETMTEPTWVHFLHIVKKEEKPKDRTFEYRTPETANTPGEFVKYPVIKRKTTMKVYIIKVYRVTSEMWQHPGISKYNGWKDRIYSCNIVGSENKKLANEIITRLTKVYPDLQEVKYF